MSHTSAFHPSLCRFIYHSLTSSHLGEAGSNLDVEGELAEAQGICMYCLAERTVATDHVAYFDCLRNFLPARSLCFFRGLVHVIQAMFHVWVHARSLGKELTELTSHQTPHNL